MKTESWNPERFFFWGILIFSAIVRLKGLSTGLPLHTLYDEQETLQTLLQLLRGSNFDPKTFVYPGLAYFIYLPFLGLFYAIGFLLGHFDGLISVPDASFILVGRIVSALLGIASVYLLFRIGKYFSTRVALLSMAILAAVPQHIEFSHILRPEIPAVFFMLLATYQLLDIYQAPGKKNYWLFGLFAGAALSLKLSIGMPLVLSLVVVHRVRRQDSNLVWLFYSIAATVGVFILLNPFLLSDPALLLSWIRRIDSLYPTGEDIVRTGPAYYLDFLIHYIYNLPLMLFAITGLIMSFLRTPGRGVVLSIYPIFIFIWNSMRGNTGTHVLLPIHPFLALWAAIALEEIWQFTRRMSQAMIFRIVYAALLCALLFWPYYRAGVQSYLFTKIDNRSKAELWMSNRLPQGSKIALLQYHQIQLDHSYFQIEDFYPKDYVSKKDFAWFKEHGFDYVVLSSGQYVQYFTESANVKRYGDYFVKFFEEAADTGTLVLDLATHPVLIPDYRIKVFSTRKMHSRPGFFPAIGNDADPDRYELKETNTLLALTPGYYVLELPVKRSHSYSISVKNLKLNDLILQKQENQPLSAAENYDWFPFTIFPIKVNSRISLFSKSHPEIASGQYVEFDWRGIPDGVRVAKIRPGIQIKNAEFKPLHKFDVKKPFVLFKKNETFTILCPLANRSRSNIAGYVEAFLGDIGEPQPWKDFEVTSTMQEFFLEPNQAITLELPVNTDNLTGDHQLSIWVFTRHDLPYAPQTGAWFNKQIRVEDARLGIHPVYGIPIP